ncbi:MAG: hypothetical protein HY231_15650 [Acidobacteria bacterium]|nr:hypothetical protein [Acidobacteriota bacterium]
MNCKALEIIISDVARQRLMEATLRDAAHTHTQDCSACAARLAQGRQLSVGLRALATFDEPKQASAQVEANLVQAFRKHHEIAPPAAALSTVVAPLSSTSFAATQSSRFTRWAIAAAAVIFIVLALVVWRLQHTGKNASPNIQQAVQPTHPDKSDFGKAENDKSISPEMPLTPDKIASPFVGDSHNKLKPPHRQASGKDAARLTSRLATTPVQPSPSTPIEPAEQEEIATPFLSLTQGYTLPMAEGGQLVRVELPRSALLSFGLPVNAARLNEPVKADVVVGNDGIARAIRFVR